MYIFYKKWVWIINLEDTTSMASQLITDWLTFLPQDFKNISTIYQRPFGEIVIIVDNMIYMIYFPSLVLVNGYPKSISSIGLSSKAKIHTAVNTYTGHTFIFYNDIYSMELDECNLRTKAYGMITKTFSGIPPDVNSAFRCINGMLYFFKGNTFYEFNEFKNSLIRAGKNDLLLFGIKCPKMSSSYSEIVNTLKNTVLQLEQLNSS
jgi:hypothetical protein